MSRGVGEKVARASMSTCVTSKLKTGNGHRITGRQAGQESTLEALHDSRPGNQVFSQAGTDIDDATWFRFCRCRD